MYYHQLIWLCLIFCIIPTKKNNECTIWFFMRWLKPGYNGHFNAHSYSAFDGEALIFFSKCVFESCSNYDFQILTKLNFKKESILLYRTSSHMFTWKKSIWISNFKAAFWNVHYIPGFTRPTPQATRTSQFWIWVEYPMK